MKYKKFEDLSTDKQWEFICKVESILKQNGLNINFEIKGIHFSKLKIFSNIIELKGFNLYDGRLNKHKKENSEILNKYISKFNSDNYSFACEINGHKY